MSKFTPSGCAWLIVGLTLIICAFMTGGAAGLVIGVVGFCLLTNGTFTK